MCLFCWRHQDLNEIDLKNIDEPKNILENAILAQQKLITGFKGDDRCDIKKWNEANNPNMIACSLSGEPTLYPKLSEFFNECHKKNMTTFLVTNGTNPKALEKMDILPKQLYVSLVAPNEDIYKKICSPLIHKGWEKIIQTLEILPSLKTRTVIRHTLVKNWNIKDKYIKEYAKLDELSSPMFIEPKGYVFVGGSRKRMNLSNMPTHEEIKNFSNILSKIIGYRFVMDKEDSRVVLLSQTSKVERIVK
jgi:tRNA wybutosine-synthesizing protein 1